ncbi:hypothetical protein CAPTEDRAFT_216691 [Capitella teleta]|uniref:SSD domain-containing protein n=1 Tax=Capitella teleta TaxID=283909 RepID=R7TC74_CAPTE|nr:hypothetical protein CAPTEDRAFT_216691 [Capitella teleta]|eukprot:ELT89102.1 hypothetical protein CAPTEDRAFT_216691 [Capitella teleta]
MRAPWTGIILPGLFLALCLIPHHCEGKSPRLRHKHRRPHHDPPPTRSRRDYNGPPLCPENCLVSIPNLQEVRSLFQDFLDDADTRLVHFEVGFTGYENYSFPLLEEYPYMSNSYEASDWVWTSGHFGRKLLSLPLDSDVLSLYILQTTRRLISLQIQTDPVMCFVKYSPECRLYAIRSLLIHNITFVEHHESRRDFVCHKVINQSVDGEYSQLVHKCCDTVRFRAGERDCAVYSTYGQEIQDVLGIINIISVLIMLFSPILILKIKIAVKFDSVTKFFRASLKHGITGQRNYVIRVSSRQLINLADQKPFSIPRFIFRLLFHCYGEGRCCIHWWGQWRHQPKACLPKALCQRCWGHFWRVFSIVIIYPSLLYIAIVLYAPRLASYVSAVRHTSSHLSHQGPLRLHINLMASAFVPLYDPALCMWMIFSVLAFLYTVMLLSWPSHPLEKCLLQYSGKRPSEQTNLLYKKITSGYKSILEKLAYGEYRTKRHFFRIPWIPWGLRRSVYCVVRLFMLIPVFNVCFTMVQVEAKLFGLQERVSDDDSEESTSQSETEKPEVSCIILCKWLLTLTVWLGFILVLCGYCTAVFTMIEFCLNIVFFTLLAAVLNATAVLPWVCCIIILFAYLNDALAAINSEHQDILQLIDANSPRISAVEDSEQVFHSGVDVQILKTHNLGAVKFIDGDNTEYVSKELYYNVCNELQCGWTHCARRLLLRMATIWLYVIFIFISLTALGSFLGSGVFLSLVATSLCAIPKLLESYLWDRTPGKSDARRHLWAKLMPDVLDKHIRVDRTLAPDDREQELTTYDVRPVGLLELDIPRMTCLRSLRLWKFPWLVSADQQTQTHESFIVALSNKLASASFLSKAVTRAYSNDMDDEGVLRQWCLLVETCILEGSATASGINGVPVESLRLFPRDVQPLVSPFDAGSTIDSVVDGINRELYGPFTKGVLVTIGNTSLAIVNIDNTLFAFNGSCHGEQVTDLFGAVLVATEFNTQNLQSLIKFIVDPYSPDAVPVYTIVPIEAFVFKSPEILDIDLSI